ncbi:MAG TPA: Rossmann-like and DUF2520 domain-containing protein [Microthrixaceae bacterium]|nr:Rossmann-like and DUF2520 domain-containing protein [Microthrixaceae bacterium]
MSAGAEPSGLTGFGSETGMRVRIIGAGRAGGSFETAFKAVGVQVEMISHEKMTRDLAGSAAEDVDLVLLCVPDRVVAEVAGSILPSETAVVAHCSGLLGLDVLGPATRRASIHPLVSLADPARGSQLLLGAYFAVAGDEIAREMVTTLGGHAVVVGDADRTIHHAACVIASNHLVALMAQVEQIANSIGVSLDAYLDLARGALDNVSQMGPAAALTGPVSRGDWETIRAHVRALPDEERDAYVALARRAAMLADRQLPDL